MVISKAKYQIRFSLKNAFAKVLFLTKAKLKRLYKQFNHLFIKRFWHVLNQASYRTNCNVLQIINRLLSAIGLTFTLARLTWYFTMQKPISLQANSKRKQSFLELLAIKFL
ncbi:hypothetical protein GGTG_11552 [Gaeumannomyces tritici R3-111a-1]|uniref:Uncharacterized protein n=1 Tax=Gaeumannomyces tritici (strain R3-111a-1) TaxID=644352 RepID=J3PDH9_GAET3|nr:hypothetical protein GGTG_11552 [Gaeumannomyces tritici R3-111a-1]EJT70529.1 hypothetical protein GGTG_11552 [Gaeumannomyces tritici R3-111a-1]